MLPSNETRARLGACALALALAIAAVYSPVRGHEFGPLDDRAFLVDNPHLDAGLSREGLAWALGANVDGSWIPLTWISFLADAELHGLSPSGTHTTNVLLHLLATWLLLLGLFRLTGALAPSAFVAGVFALHPLHVESVAWAIERKDVLSGVFFCATLLAYAGYARRGGALRMASVVGLLTLGLLAKSMLVTTPFVLLLLDAWPLRRLGSPAARRRALLEKLPMLALVAVVSFVTLRTQRELGAMDTGDTLALPLRLMNALTAYVGYLAKAFWPVDLCVFYPHPREALETWRAAASGALLAAVTALALASARRLPYLAVGWLWFLGMLVPVIGLVQVGSQAMADRYSYLPLIGLSLAVAFAAADAAARRPALRRPLAVAALVALAALGVRAAQQRATWRDGETLFRHALEVEERNEMAHLGLAVVLLERGETEAAARHLGRALEIRPGMTDAHVNLGVALTELGRPRDALPHLARGLGLREPRVGRVHAQLGLAHQRAGDAEQAADHYRRALELGEVGAGTPFNLGVLLAERGDVPGAAAALDEAERRGMASAELYLTQARIRASSGDEGGAVERLKRAVAVDPTSLEAHNNLAWTLATSSDPTLRDPKAALHHAREALRRGGAEIAAVLDTASVAFAEAGLRAEALELAERAIERARSAGDETLARGVEARAAAWRRAEGAGIR